MYRSGHYCFRTLNGTVISFVILTLLEKMYLIDDITKYLGVTS